MSSKITFDRQYPLPAYDGPQPVYRARFPWASSVDCYVRRNGPVWETAPIAPYLQNARFTPCPVAQAADTRSAAVMAFDYYHNRGLQS